MFKVVWSVNGQRKIPRLDVNPASTHVSTLTYNTCAAFHSITDEMRMTLPRVHAHGSDAGTCASRNPITDSSRRSDHHRWASIFQQVATPTSLWRRSRHSWEMHGSVSLQCHARKTTSLRWHKTCACSPEHLCIGCVCRFVCPT